MEKIEDAASGLRAAISTQRFTEAQEIAAEYARLVAEEWRKLPRGGAEAARLWREARELLAWARRTALAQRAHLAARLKAIEPLAWYLRGQGREAHTWGVDG